MKIAIIGSGGAGMCASWLLDQEHDISLFEKRNYLGGHTHSVDVKINDKTFIVDDGAAWFSPSIYPFFNAYLELVGVEFDWLPLSLTYYDKTRNHVNCMPPINFRNILKIFTKKAVLKELLALNKVVNASKKLVENHDASLSFLSFINSLSIDEKTKSSFIKPLLTGVWGSPYDQTNDFSIYPLMKYIVYHKPSGLQYYNWKTMKGGTKKYISTVHHSLSNTKTYIDEAITHIEYLKENSQVRVTTNQGTYNFDKVIITGGATDTAKIIENSKDYQTAYAILKQFNYYKAYLATHSDASLMPPDRKDWSVVNVKYDGTSSFATIWHGSKTNTDIFCSYINPENKEIKNIHHLSVWNLPCETPEFFKLQKELSQVQGLNNVFFAGDYTHDIGSHEDAIISAVKAVEVIDSNNNRLHLLKNKAATFK